MKNIINEFKEFVLRGNVLDLAVGVIIGASFQSIVTSLISNIISPIIGCFTIGGFEGWTIPIWKANLAIGAFLMDVVNFVIMAFVVFLIVKGVNKLTSIGSKRKKEKAEEIKTKTETELLEEILKELKKKAK